MSDSKRNLDNPKWAHKAERKRKTQYKAYRTEFVTRNK